MKKNACFIVPYFGKLPSYFQLFLNSCAVNKKFDWILFTDDKTEYFYPKNVKRIYTSWNNFKLEIQKKFKIPVSLKYTRKLCDYKPAYGYLFEEYIKKYPYWGYCDVDTIMGNLDRLLPLSFLEKYDKLFALGHMVLFKNSSAINRLFMKKIDKKYLYKKIFTDDRVKVFDEVGASDENIDAIFMKNNYKVFHEDWSLNPRVTPTRFQKVVYDFNQKKFTSEKRKDALCIWNGHEIVRYIFKKSGIKKEYYLYMHLQQRKMKLGKNVLNAKAFAIIPNEFIPLKNINENYLRKVRRRGVTLHYLRIMWRWKVKSKFSKYKGQSFGK